MKILRHTRFFSHTLETKIEANRHQRAGIYEQLTQNKERNVMSGCYDRDGFRSYSSKNVDSHYKSLLTHP